MGFASIKETFSEHFASGLKPDPILTVSEWAERYRHLSQKQSAEAGKWRNSRTPYLTEIMDCLSPNSIYQEVVFKKASQIGGTECGNNFIGFIIDRVPGPLLVVQPTVEIAKRYSKQRIDPLIEENEQLQKKVMPKRSRDSGNTVQEKDFIGGVMIITGANSAAGLRSMPMRYIFMDEIDAYPQDVDGEGDPILLAEARSRTFAKKKIFKVSTPTFEGRSKIESEFQESDQRHYMVPCPHCKEGIEFLFPNLKWEVSNKGQAEKVFYACQECGGEILESNKTAMLKNGKWVAQNDQTSGKKAGFFLNSLYSPVGWYSWTDIANDFLESKGKEERLRGFVNTVLGETWKDKGEAPEWERLYERRELYDIGTVPKGGLFLTCGVDVQKDRFELEIVAWGRNKESWSVDYRVIMGDTSQPVSWQKLEEVLYETFPHENGGSMAIKMMAVDSGYNTQSVYSWVRRFNLNHVVAIKGSDTASNMVHQPSSVDVMVNGRKIARGLKVWTLGVNLLKQELYSFLRQAGATEENPTPYGFCHFPMYGEEFFKQLTAEQLVVKLVRGYKKHQWEKIRDRNEALDARCYARAAAAILGVDRYKDRHWQKLESELGMVKKRKNGETNQEKTQNKRRKSTWL